MVAVDCCRALKSFIIVWTGLINLQGTDAQRNDRGNSDSSLDSANFFYQQSDLPKDCKEIADRCSSGEPSGVHYIQPAGYPEPFQVYCDVSHNASGWTVISRREYGGLVDFSRDAVSYKEGFGFMSHEFWSISQYSGATAEDACTTDTDCMDVYKSGSTSSGVYSIKPTSWAGAPFRVYCNMTDGGGWTVFQRRVDGSVDFNLDWDDYKDGFGDVSHEHWLGNEQLYHLTNQREYQIRIDVVNDDGDPYYAKFDSFWIDSEDHNYNLSMVGNYSGDADECGNGGYWALTYQQGAEFSTKDRDNEDMDENSSQGSSVGWHDSCARGYGGAWWYTDDCYNYHYYYYYINLNGHYSNYYGFYMYCLPGSNYLTFSEMKLQPV